MPTYDEDDLLPISALQHLVFCERQCALIHIEHLWAENRFTVLGSEMHRRTHDGPDEQRAGVRICRGLPLRSLRLGLTGIADVVEFPVQTTADLPDPLDWLEEEWAADNEPALADADSATPTAPFPVEYKRGKPKLDQSDEVQLCAQALCLEEMLNTAVPAGALYYGKPRRRHPVEFTLDLRQETERLAARLHELIRSGRTPPAEYAAGKCRACSLVDLCLPQSTGGRSAKRYLDRMIRAACQEPQSA